jgi:hypothetical protein
MQGSPATGGGSVSSRSDRRQKPPLASTAAPWEELNARRLQLIDREFKGGLTPAEQEELRILQEEADKHIKLPSLDIFRELEECAIREGLLPGDNR